MKNYIDFSQIFTEIYEWEKGKDVCVDEEFKKID